MTDSAAVSDPCRPTLHLSRQSGNSLETAGPVAALIALAYRDPETRAAVIRATRLVAADAIGQRRDKLLALAAALERQQPQT